ncbi:MAG: hypothetical protein HFH12_09450 [Dorea sp.]|nr:hypothetical protein [Dorea sp.]
MIRWNYNNEAGNQGVVFGVSSAAMRAAGSGGRRYLGYDGNQKIIKRAVFGILSENDTNP